MLRKRWLFGPRAEAHGDDCAAARRVRGDRPSAAGLGRLPHDRQPEARPRQRPGALRAKEAVEHVWEVVVLEAWAVVAHRQLAAAQPHLDEAAGRAPLARIVDQVRDRAHEALLLTTHERRLELEVEREAVAPTPPRTLDELLGHDVEPDVVDLALGRLFISRELDDSRHQRRQLVELTDDVASQLGHLLRWQAVRLIEQLN